MFYCSPRGYNLSPNHPPSHSTQPIRNGREHGTEDLVLQCLTDIKTSEDKSSAIARHANSSTGLDMVSFNADSETVPAEGAIPLAREAKCEKTSSFEDMREPRDVFDSIDYDEDTENSDDKTNTGGGDAYCDDDGEEDEEDFFFEKRNSTKSPTLSTSARYHAPDDVAAVLYGTIDRSTSRTTACAHSSVCVPRILIVEDSKMTLKFEVSTVITIRSIGMRIKIRTS